ncbi:MAG: 4-deoxy-4-formamido-L-arabinose-phosphoundecaprenol deformylase [Gallionellales bacterium CG_4_10_14_3_um_filter_54_96]|nr:MAG: 4-deoxy-4-formamido-L-arabinose-phosphoundecaprenol deformylase [Gallionellales bacterium CG_4_8_14_3_um_filter_54_18]PIY06179.1 MAG: 4-deoxy-4-formamido-L-arabinose-phosphoundecaprenol deformylase [Gallionellales bacterium CG_4_10_14_3_um_filter_54_96]PJC05556.1 MAG: 4-deoxy-4-formamido-L-arabinose-phosphoundecaprenol deformylase [Gallionellales bacterium CG_4_9_14_0_8_um_filter_55_61]HCJ52019.1 4-deoxy-4-formamido-L-arabinose-phosphoundecaprenol deformylase [Gallionella sp.]
MKQLALQIHVDTYRGTREGVPRLVEVLQRYHAGATFFFSLGPDHTGRAIKRVFRPGFLGKVSRTSVVEHYGIKTLLYGTLLPGPDIGKKCKDILCGVRDAGFEVGIHCYDHIRWQDTVANADNLWTERELQRTVDRYAEIFGEAPHAHAAAGWQMNRHALRLMQRAGFDYSSDTRGTHPFIPTWQAEIVACPQLPTTLPTLDELMNRDGITLDNVAEYVLQLTANALPTGHVYTLHAELEGQKWMPVFEQLLQGWQAQGYELVSMQQYLQGLAAGALPRHAVEMREIPGRSGTLAVQGEKS